MTNKTDKRKLSDDLNKSDASSPLHNGNAEIATQENKKQKVFSARTFRRSLSTNEALDNVKEFVVLCTEDKREDYAMQYLEVGGNCLELVHLLEKKISHAAPILQAINIVILKVIATSPQHIPQTEDACRNLLNNYATTVQSVLSSDSTPKQRRVVLQLFTSIVTLSPILAKEILNQIQLNDMTLSMLIEPSIGDQSQSVRTCFIRFIVSFLIEGNVANIKMLLERKYISSIFNDLIYDEASTVHLLLTTLKKYVLENMSILKTTKLYTFNTGVVKHLVNLYNWKGYRYWRLKIRIKSTYPVDNMISVEDKELVVETVHDFLLLLCTSVKHGIVFNDKTLGLGGKNHNPLIQTVLESLHCPWEHKYASELVVAIVKACPDLFKFVIGSVADYLEPRDSNKWFNLVGFLKQIFTTKKNIMENIKGLSDGQLLGVCVNFFVPEVVLKCFKTENFLNNSNLKVYGINVDLFDHILRQLIGFLQDLIAFGIVNDEAAFHSSLRQAIIKYLPPIKMIVGSWKVPRDSSEEMGKTYKISIVNILNSYCKLFPLSLQEIQVDFTPEKLLEDTEDCEGEIKREILLNAVDLFLSWDVNAFLPSNDHFMSYLSVLLEKIDDKSMEVIKKILLTTKIFHNDETEIEIWLGAVKTFSSQATIKILNESIVKSFNGLSQNQDEIICTDSTNEMNKEIDDIFDNLEYGNLTYTNENPKHKKISLVLLNVSDLLKTYKDLESLSFYMFALVNLFHVQTIPNYVLNAINFDQIKKIGKKFKQFKGITKYFNSWNTNEIVALSDSIPELEIVGKLSRALLTEEPMEMASVIKIEDSQENRDVTNEISDKSPINMNLVQMTMFYFTQQLTKKLLVPNKIENHVNSLIFLHKILKSDDKIVEIIYKNPIIYHNFVPLSSSKEKIHRNTTEFVLKITKYFKSVTQNLKFLDPYREKLFTRIIITLSKYHKNLSSNRSELLISLIETLDLNYKQSLQIVEKITQIPSSALITKDNSLSIFVNLLSLTLTRICHIYTDSTNEMISSETFAVTIQHLTLLMGHGTNIDCFIESLQNFLAKFPHFIAQINPELIQTITNRSEPRKIEIRFLIFLLEKNEKLIKPINKTIDQIIDKKDLIFALLKILLNHKKFLALNKTEAIFVKYAHVIQKIVEKPQKIGVNIREYYQGVIGLIEHAMPVQICVKLAQKIHKPEVIEMFHLDVLEAIVLKATIEDNKTTLTNYLQSLIHLLIVALKRNESIKLEMIIGKIECFIGKIDGDFDWESIRTGNNWLVLIRLLLKHGIKNTDDNRLLHTLVVLCDKIYLNNEKVSEEISMIHEMILSHSEFLDLILSNGRNKTELLKLLLILTVRDKSVILPKLVPVLLGAYNATLNLNDRLILALLSRYESASVDFHNYRPYLWGETAINHYSVRNNIETALWRQSNASHVFNLFVANNVIDTISNFDLKRPLLVDDVQIQTLLQTNDEMEIVKRSPDKWVRLKQSHINRKLGKFSTAVVDGVYDPCFYLPLFSHLLAFESSVPYYKFTESGGLALTLLALASECPLMRQAAYNVLSRFHYHVEAKGDSRNKDLWLEFINAIRRALVHICDDSKIEDVRIPYIYAVFLARSSIIMTEPLNRMFTTVNNFLFVKEVHDFRLIPEFLHLMHSPDVNYRVHRIWLLQVIRDGFRTKLDFDSAHRTLAFKILMDFYSSVLADVEIKSLLLEIIVQALKVPKAYRFLMSSCLLSWLSIVADGLQMHEMCLVEPMIEILNVLWRAEGSQAEQRQLSRASALRASCWLKLLLKISRNLSANLKVDCFAKFVMILTRVYQTKTTGLERDDLQRIVALSETILGESDCKYVMHFGCKFVERPRDFEGVSDARTLALNYVRLLTILWVENNRLD